MAEAHRGTVECLSTDVGDTAGKPLVVVTGPHKSLRFGWWATRFMLWMCGLRGHYVTPRRASIPDRVRGVIIGGGDDIQPRHYGLTGDAGAKYDAERDALELRIFKQAYDCGIPVLGICRGAQMINVALGGNLHQDIRPIRRKTPNRNSIFPIKKALLEPASKIFAIIGQASISVNSLHNQAVDSIAEPLQQCAADADKFVQAVEHCKHEFIIGVQWHPEYMPYARAQRKLFTSFSAAVRATSNTLPTGQQEHSI